MNNKRGFSLVETLLVVSTSVVLTSMTVPNFLTSIKNYKLDSQAQAIRSAITTVKVQASATNTHARLYVDNSAGTYREEYWSRSSSTWVTTNGPFKLESGVTLSYGSISGPPASTQASLAQAPLCTDNSGSTVANTVCVTFNSRAFPIDNSGALTGNDAVYLTNGNSVYGLTVSIIGTTGVWRTPASTTNWIKR